MMSNISRRPRAALASAALLVALAGCTGAEKPQAEAGQDVALAPAATVTPVSDTLVVYKTATCGCCKDWIEHMEENGFTVVAHDYSAVRLNELKLDAGVQSDLASCHTALIGGYVVEGHVPADLVKRMLEERPQITGLAVPGMPVGSPGMDGPVKQDYQVMAFTKAGAREVYAER
jgi:hypothetical protein